MFLPGTSILLNIYGTALFEQVINIARLIDRKVFVRVQVCVRVCIIQSSRGRITDILSFTISYSIKKNYSKTAQVTKK